ncbi:hypothetical protein [Hymenobacter yonginensis]|uniref:Uncharacterized protein n=1 Tax=Hymenobacter yonginensis TaxID=748197 RepID=A0ABY7PIZ4_9BACT|nr:hypothetical protein [Hymenobacter yonginensis]WBO83267.1 hypothetical protein O9Z63_12845 [Hymenobacter yonginensis]
MKLQITSRAIPLLFGLGWSLASCRVEQRLILPQSAQYQAAAEAPVTTDTARPSSSTLLIPELKRNSRVRPAAGLVLRPLTRPLMPQAKATHPHTSARRHQAPQVEAQHRRQPAEGGVVFGVFHLLLLLAGAALFVVLGLILFPMSTILGLFAFVVALAGVVGAVLDIIRIAR